jgi:hypothetical protein
MTAKQRILPALLSFGLAVGALPAGAQQRQYVTPGDLALIEVPRKESLEDAMSKAPWELGDVKIQPRLSISDLQRVDNVFDASDSSENERVTDWRLTTSAGLDAYLPISEKTLLSAFLRPNYAWWEDNDQLRRLNWSYGVAAYGFLNRLSTRLTLKRSESERLVNSELQIPATIRQDRIALDVDLRLRGPWQLFTSAAHDESRYPNADVLIEQAPNLGSLSRDEDIIGFGIAYDIPARLNVGVGWRRVESTFLDDPDGRSNQGSYPFVKVAIPGNRLKIAAEVGLRELEFVAAETLESRDEVLGTVQTIWQLGRRTNLSVYGGRDLVYSAVDTGGFFNSQRLGTALIWGGARALTVRLFAEGGEEEFESAGDALPGRLDDFGAVGVKIRFPTRKRLTVQLGLVETELDSNFDEFDRSVTVLSSTIGLDLPDLPF